MHEVAACDWSCVAAGDANRVATGDAMNDVRIKPPLAFLLGTKREQWNYQHNLKWENLAGQIRRLLKKESRTGLQNPSQVLADQSYKLFMIHWSFLDSDVQEHLGEVVFVELPEPALRSKGEDDNDILDSFVLLRGDVAESCESPPGEESSKAPLQQLLVAWGKLTQDIAEIHVKLKELENFLKDEENTKSQECDEAAFRRLKSGCVRRVNEKAAAFMECMIESYLRPIEFTTPRDCLGRNSVTESFTFGLMQTIIGRNGHCVLQLVASQQSEFIRSRHRYMTRYHQVTQGLVTEKTKKMKRERGGDVDREIEMGIGVPESESLWLESESRRVNRWRVRSMDRSIEELRELVLS
ncbi:hypothetical protein Syun_003886 [Stephania yunnanensis]|uniref:Uncharacterized protein n=1 Tax=Stephania yunnanensis TaxID=152371 RepID=A0AAP0Q214_9MAGN